MLPVTTGKADDPAAEELRLQPRTFGKLWSRLLWMPTAEAEEFEDGREIEDPRWGRWVDPDAIREGRTETTPARSRIEAAWGYQRRARGAGEIAERARVGWLFSMRLIVTIEAPAARVRDGALRVERRAATGTARPSALGPRERRGARERATAPRRRHRAARVWAAFVRYARLVVAAKRAGADAADQDAFAVIEHGPVRAGARARVCRGGARARALRGGRGRRGRRGGARARARLPRHPGRTRSTRIPGRWPHHRPGRRRRPRSARGGRAHRRAPRRSAGPAREHWPLTPASRAGDAAARDEAQRGARGAGGGASEYRIDTPEQLTPAELYEREEGHVWLEGSGFLVVPVKQPTHHDRHPKVPLQCEVTYVVRLRVPDDRIDEWMFRWKTLIHERTTALFELKEICEAEEERATAASAS